jgi:hypothetical protein
MKIIFKSICFVCILFNCFVINAFQLPKNKFPVRIDVEIQINKIYDINTVNETYIIDGYLVANWVDTTTENVEEPIIYENILLEKKVANGFWMPAFEFINVIGDREISNKRVILNPNNIVTYNERFRAVFSEVMDFKKFPFDTQTFSIQLEAFSYDETKLFFSDAKINKHWEVSGMSEEWEVLNKKIHVNSIEYPHLDKNKPLVFSRYNLEVRAERKTNYYIWQFILPLILIIILSWTVFWMTGFSDKLAVGFTLLLTVVAFNFKSATVLPKLPYKTFIESLITLSYLTIFISILLVVFGTYYTKDNKNLTFSKLMKISRYVIPILFILLVLLQLHLSFN